MRALSATPIVNAAIDEARTLPDLIAKLPPGLATQLLSKPLLFAKSPPGVFLATGVTWVSARYGLGWSADTCAIVAGVACYGAGLALRALTCQPIAGIVRTPAGVPPAEPAPAPTSISRS